MNTSSKFTVAAHILASLAARRMASGYHVPIKSNMLALSVNTNPVVIRRLLGALRDKGLVRSQTGPDGGTRLALEPERISLLDIYEAVEDADLFHLHYNCPSQACPVGANIQGCLTEIFDEAESAMKSVLAQKTLGDLAYEILDRSNILERLRNGATAEELEKEYMQEFQSSLVCMKK